jgi:hypothetical protein
LKFKNNDNLNFLVVVISFFTVLYLMDSRREVRVTLCANGDKVTYFGIGEIKSSDFPSSNRCASKLMTKRQWYSLRDRTYENVRKRKSNGGRE